MTNSSELHVIIGPMFSGKTTELINIANRYSSISNVLIINHTLDDRYSTNDLVSHSQIKIPCSYTNNLLSILPDTDNFDIICINEAQFFENLYNFCNIILKKNNKKIYVSGLDGDYNQQKFGEIIDIIPLSNTVQKLNSLCKICNNGTLAHFTKRLNQYTEQVHIGSDKDYIPVCRTHL